MLHVSSVSAKKYTTIHNYHELNLVTVIPGVGLDGHVIKEHATVKSTV